MRTPIANGKKKSENNSFQLSEIIPSVMMTPDNSRHSKK